MTTDEKIRAYTHSRLSDAARAAFEGEMAGNPDLRAEVAAITAVQKPLAESFDDMPKHGWERLSDKIDAQSPVAANSNKSFTPPFLIAACILLTAVLGVQFAGMTLSSDEPKGYSVASAENVGPTVQIMFNSMAILSDVSETLAALNGRIVDGPSALGMFTVAFPDAEARDAAFVALRERSDIVAEILQD